MLNQVTLIGRIATEIDLRYTPGKGTAVAKFNLAVNRNYNSKQEADFIRVEVWGKQAENTAQYVGKGSKVAVTGELNIDQYEKDGQKRTATKVKANNVTFLDSKKKDFIDEEYQVDESDIPEDIR